MILVFQAACPIDGSRCGRRGYRSLCSIPSQPWAARGRTVPPSTLHPPSPTSCGQWERMLPHLTIQMWTLQLAPVVITDLMALDGTPWTTAVLVEHSLGVRGVGSSSLPVPTISFNRPQVPAPQETEDLCRTCVVTKASRPVLRDVTQCRWGWSAKPKTAPNAVNAGPRYHSLLLGITRASFDP